MGHTWRQFFVLQNFLEQTSTSQEPHGQYMSTWPKQKKTHWQTRNDNLNGDCHVINYGMKRINRTHLTLTIQKNTRNVVVVPISMFTLVILDCFGELTWNFSNGYGLANPEWSQRKKTHNYLVYGFSWPCWSQIPSCSFLKCCAWNGVFGLETSVQTHWWWRLVCQAGILKWIWIKNSLISRDQ